MPIRALVRGALSILLVGLCALAASAQHAPTPAVVRPGHPQDSRGETVYEPQTADLKNAPVVPGVLIAPRKLKIPKLKYPKDLRKTHPTGSVIIEGVVADNGDFIDAEVMQPADPELTQSAMDAALKYKFKPATLDGQPVAVPLKIEFHFESRRW